MKDRTGGIGKSVLVAATLMLMAGGVHAQSSIDDTDASTPSAGAMAFDLVLVRPLSLGASVLGAGLFILDLPLSIFQKDAPAEPFHQLVVNPIRYTFTRPLGKLD